MLDKVLLELGMTAKEAKVYLACLRGGAQPASVIAKNSGLNRTTTYEILDSLTNKGMARKANKFNMTYFEVIDPADLISHLERTKRKMEQQIDGKIAKIQEIIPLLVSLKNPLSTRPRMQFFEGESGMVEAYEQTLKSSETIRAFVNVQDIHELMPDFFPDYYKRRASKGIDLKAICPKNEQGIERQKFDKQELREIRFIDNKYDFSPELSVFDDKTLITSWREKMAITIESQEIAHLFKMFFDALWKEIK